MRTAVGLWLRTTGRAALACLMLVALLVRPTPARAWDCSMSGARACPCACSAAEQDDHDSSEVRRPACCEARPQAADSFVAAVGMTRPDIDALAEATPVPLVPGVVATSPPPAPRVRGPPRAPPRLFLSNCALLL